MGMCASEKKIAEAIVRTLIDGGLVFEQNENVHMLRGREQNSCGQLHSGISEEDKL